MTPLLVHANSPQIASDTTRNQSREVSFIPLSCSVGSVRAQCGCIPTLLSLAAAIIQSYRLNSKLEVQPVKSTIGWTSVMISSKCRSSRC